MNNLVSSPNDPLIKSWFGFLMGAIFVGIGLVALFETFTLSKVLSSLGFLCFWYPWSQIPHWNRSIKNFFKAEDHPMSKPCIYLTLIATTLLVTSTFIHFII